VSIWKVILATLVIFGAGVIAGASFINRLHQTAHAAAAGSDASTRHPLNPWETPVINTNNPPRSVRAKNDFLNRFGQQLEITSEQHARIEQILGDSQKRTKEISDSVAPYLREEVRHTRELIRNELTAEQLVKYDEIFRPKSKKKTDDPNLKPVVPKKNARLLTQGE